MFRLRNVEETLDQLKYVDETSKIATVFHSQKSERLGGFVLYTLGKLSDQPHSAGASRNLQKSRLILTVPIWTVSSKNHPSFLKRDPWWSISFKYHYNRQHLWTTRAKIFISMNWYLQFSQVYARMSVFHFFREIVVETMFRVDALLQITVFEKMKTSEIRIETCSLTVKSKAI